VRGCAAFVHEGCAEAHQSQVVPCLTGSFPTQVRSSTDVLTRPPGEVHELRSVGSRTAALEVRLWQLSLLAPGIYRCGCIDEGDELPPLTDLSSDSRG
jgi:hypothetical protein